MPDGPYIMRVYPVDAYGNTGTWAERTVNVVAALRVGRDSAAVFFPQDLDAIAKTTTLSFDAGPPDDRHLDAAQRGRPIVDTRIDAVERPAGDASLVFDGRRTDGTMLPPGRYTSFVNATDGTLTASQAVAFEADAFSVKLTDATPGPRPDRDLSRHVRRAAVGDAPRAYIYEPGPGGVERRR